MLGSVHGGRKAAKGGEYKMETGQAMKGGTCRLVVLSPRLGSKQLRTGAAGSRKARAAGAHQRPNRLVEAPQACFT